MNKILSGVIVAGLVGISAEADVLRVEAGVGVWNQDPDGYVKYKNAPSFSNADVGYTDENRVYAWVNIKHPVPVLPNIRLEYTPMEFSGTSIVGFDYNNVAFSAGAQSTLTLDQYDAVLYYNILDNTGWVTLDLGLDIKYIDTSFEASQTGGYVNEGDTLVLPMAYARVRYELLATDIGLEADVKYVPYKNSEVYDCRIKVDYTMDLSVIDLGVEAGYRFESIHMDHNDFSSLDTTGNMDINGFYAGIMARF